MFTFVSVHELHGSIVVLYFPTLAIYLFTLSSCYIDVNVQFAVYFISACMFVVVHCA